LASKAPLVFLLFSILIKLPSHSSLLILMSITIPLSQYRLLIFIVSPCMFLE
jgi:hypothetical protein